VKPAPFKYLRASSTEEAVGLLGEWDGGARILAGGQSLVPLLNMRLLQPEAIIDVNRIDGLGEISEDEGGVRVGALTRYSSVEWSPVVGSRLPLLTEVVRHIGDRQVRSRGTVGGSLAHADPTGELPLAALALEATVIVRGPEGTREINANDFFEGPYATVLASAEMITEVRFPTRRAVSAFAEHARRHGDFCIVSVAAVGEPNGNGGWSSIRLALGGVSYRPFVATEASELLAGKTLEPDVTAAAGAAAAGAAEPSDDIRASAEYRLHLIPIYVRRVLQELERRRKEGAQ
jgi:aerobic carbon-monoxide dehydrogenase medium subunit